MRISDSGSLFRHPVGTRTFYCIVLFRANFNMIPRLLSLTVILANANFFYSFTVKHATQIIQNDCYQ